MPRANTIRQPFTQEGIGIHSGTPSRVTVAPTSRGRGRIFRRDGIEIPALVDAVVDTRRCTTLGRHGVSIGMVEHLLAALLVSHVDDVEITVEGSELPALDGSALPWYSAIQQAGVCPSGGEPLVLRLMDTQWIDDEDSQFFLSPSRRLTLFGVLSIPETVAIDMAVGGTVEEPAVCAQILRARTFGLEREVAVLLANGLAQGGTLANAVVLTRDGYLNHTVWPREPAWHKIQDLLGDLALVGARIYGQIIAIHAGHRSHVALARRLRAEMCASSLPAVDGRTGH